MAKTNEKMTEIEKVCANALSALNAADAAEKHPTGVMSIAATADAWRLIARALAAYAGAIAAGGTDE